MEGSNLVVVAPKKKGKWKIIVLAVLIFLVLGGIIIVLASNL